MKAQKVSLVLLGMCLITAVHSLKPKKRTGTVFAKRSGSSGRAGGKGMKALAERSRGSDSQGNQGSPSEILQHYLESAGVRLVKRCLSTAAQDFSRANITADQPKLHRFRELKIGEVEDEFRGIFTGDLEPSEAVSQETVTIIHPGCHQRSV